VIDILLPLLAFVLLGVLIFVLILIATVILIAVCIRDWLAGRATARRAAAYVRSLTPAEVAEIATPTDRGQQ
jgi:hypothetical protein